MLLSVVWDITALSPADSLELWTFPTQEHAGGKRGGYLNDTSKKAAKGVLEKQNALVKSTVYLPFFFLHPLCLYVYRVSLECSHLEKQYLCFLVEEFVFFFSSSAIKTQGLFWWHSWFLGQASLNQSYPSAFQLGSSLIFHLCAT